MPTIHQQFIALQRAAHRKASEGVSAVKRGSILRAAAYEVLADAIAALPLDSLAGEPALKPVLHDDTLEETKETFRLSQVGGHCVYCHAIIEEALQCPGCGHVDPPTVGS